MSSAPDAAEIARDATWLPQALDADKELVRLVKMDRGAYRAASFLDDRMFAQKMESVVLPWTTIERSATDVMRDDARWIFHIGHVGSTLVSRLLGEIEGVLSVREPRSLRDLASLVNERRVEFTPAIRKLLSRTFAADEKALIKATSFVSEVAPELVANDGCALFMYGSPRNYIGSILAGENSVKEMAALAPIRARRAGGRAALPEPRTPADAAALAWACEMTSLEAAADAMPGRNVSWADFDRMLEDMPNALIQTTQLLGFDAAAERLHAIATGPLMRRYSKAVEYEYSASLRRELIDEATAANGADIDSAVAMLHSAARGSPLLARALDRSS